MIKYTFIGCSYISFDPLDNLKGENKKVLNRTKKMKIRSLSVENYSFTRVKRTKNHEDLISLEEIKNQMKLKMKQLGYRTEEVPQKKANVIMRVYKRIYFQQGADSYYNVFGAAMYTKKCGRWFTDVWGIEQEIDLMNKVGDFKSEFYEAQSESCDYYLKVR